MSEDMRQITKNNWRCLIKEAIVSLPANLILLVKEGIQTPERVQIRVFDNENATVPFAIIEARYWDSFSDCEMVDEARQHYQEGGVLHEYYTSPAVVITHAGMEMDDPNLFTDGFMGTDLIEGIQVAILNCLVSTGHVSRDENGRYWFPDGRQVVDQDGNGIVNAFYSDEMEDQDE